MYGYDMHGRPIDAGAAAYQQRMIEMQRAGYNPPQPYPRQNFYEQMPAQNQTPMLNGRVVTGIEEARAAQIPLDGTMVYFPSPAEKKIYVKSIGLDGMPLFNVYEMAVAPSGANNIVYADNAAVIALQRRVEQIENILKGAASNVQSNANDAVNGTVAE